METNLVESKYEKLISLKNNCCSEDIYNEVMKLNHFRDKFSLALMLKDSYTLRKLYDTVSLTNYQISKLKRIKLSNKYFFLTLHPDFLDKKFEFLDEMLEVLVLDTTIQEKMMSLSDYELNLIKRIYNRLKDYQVKPNEFIDIIVSNIGTTPIDKNAKISKEKDFIKQIQEFEITGPAFTNSEIDNLIYILRSNCKYIITSREEITNFSQVIKQRSKEIIEKSNDIRHIKEVFLSLLCAYHAPRSLLRYFSMEGIPQELKNDETYKEYLLMKSIEETNSVELLKNIFSSFIENYDFDLFSSRINSMKENLINLYAKSYNACKVDFNKISLIKNVEGINIYDLGVNFKIKIKVIGAFHKESRYSDNYYQDWNEKNFLSHINAISLIGNDNLCIASQTSEQEEFEVVVGFNEFDEKMLLNMSPRDIRSSSNDKRISCFGIPYEFYFPQQFINKTRCGHNELDYERKDLSPNAVCFKKNPDFIVFFEERIDPNYLTEAEKEKNQKNFEKTVNVAKDFGGIPIVIINREKCAISEMEKIKNDINSYIETLDFSYLESAIIRFGNNRNGCRFNHAFIREHYFSDFNFREIISNILSIISDDQKDKLVALLKNEKSLNFFSYEKPDTFTIPYFECIQIIENNVKAKL